MGSSPAQQIGVRTASSACRRDGRPRSTAPQSRDVHRCASAVVHRCSLSPHLVRTRTLDAIGRKRFRNISGNLLGPDLIQEVLVPNS